MASDVTMPHATRNTRFLYLDVTFWGVANGIASTFTTIFALRLGATDQQVGFISALPALIYLLWYLPAGRLVESGRSVKKTALASFFLFRLQYLLIALVPFLPERWRVTVLLGTIVLAGVPLCVANVAITDILADVIPPAQRPHIVSRRSILTSLISAIAAALAGRLLDLLPMPVNYQWMFIVAFIFGNLSIGALSRLVVADTPPKGTFSLHIGEFVRHMREMLSVVRQTPDFVRFTLAAMALYAGLIFAWPLFSLWWVKGLKAPEGMLGLIATANLLVSIGSNLVWARIAERKGNRFCMVAGFACVTMMPAINAALPSAQWLLLTESFAGMVVPGMNLGLFNTLLEVCPIERRTTYIAVYSAAINVPTFIAPIVATALVAPLLGVQLTLALSTPLRLVTLAIMLVLLRHIRPFYAPPQPRSSG